MAPGFLQSGRSQREEKRQAGIQKAFYDSECQAEFCGGPLDSAPGARVELPPFEWEQDLKYDEVSLP